MLKLKKHFLTLGLLLAFCTPSFGQSPYTIDLVEVEMVDGVVVDSIGVIPNGGSVIAGDNTYMLRFTKDNNHINKGLLYVSVLDIQPDNVINILYPRPSENPADYRINSKDNEFVIPNSFIKFAPPYGTESLVVIFSKEPLTFDIYNTRSRSDASSLSKTEIEWLLSGSPPEYLDGQIALNRYSFEIRPKQLPPMSGGGVGTNGRGRNFKSSHTVRDRHVISNDEIIKTYPDMFFISPPEPSYDPSARGGKVSKVSCEVESFVVRGQLRGDMEVESVEIYVVSEKDTNLSASYSTTNFKPTYRSVEFERQIGLFPGKNEIDVVAYGANGYGVSQRFIIESTPQENKVTGKDYLVLMAIDKYAHWPQLQNPVNDATSIGKALQDHYNVEVENTMHLFNENCTPKSVDSVFRLLIKTLTPNDRLIVYFAGHGYYDEAFETGYWIPVNGKMSQEDTWINNDRIGKYIKYLPTKHTLFISDACFSGSLYIDDTRSKGTDRHYDVLDKARSRWMFSSGRLEEVADDYQNTNHSPFAWFILNYLEEPHNPQFSVNDLAVSVTKSVSNNSEQSPVAKALKNAGDEGGEYVFYYKE